MSDTLQQTDLIVDALQKVRDEALRHGRRPDRQRQGH